MTSGQKTDWDYHKGLDGLKTCAYADCAI